MTKYYIIRTQMNDLLHQPVTCPWHTQRKVLPSIFRKFLAVKYSG